MQAKTLRQTDSQTFIFEQSGVVGLEQAIDLSKDKAL
jgi:hypothetical protein